MATYTVDDALEVIEGLDTRSVQFIHLDDAWARPARNGAFGVRYSTHPFDDTDSELVEDEPGVTTELTVVDMLDACHRVLDTGGIIAVDTDSYLLSRVIEYFQSEWSQSCFAVAQVTALTKQGEPDRSTPGMYGSTGGYALSSHGEMPPRLHPIMPVGAISHCIAPVNGNAKTGVGGLSSRLIRT